MSVNWPVVKLGDYVELLTGNPFKSKDFSDSVGIRLLRGDNIVQGKFRWENVKRWPESLLVEKHNSYFLKQGDVILAMDRPWIEAGLKFGQISEHDLPCLLVQRTSCLRAKAGLNQDFLKYLIASYDFVEYIKLVQTGTAVPHISGKQIKDFEFKLPPEHVQIAVGQVLKSLDSKVETNRLLNQTLEQIAQAIFKSWFVDFEPVKAKIAAREALIAEYQAQSGKAPSPQEIAAVEKKAAIAAIAGDIVPTAQLQTLADLFPSQLVDSELGQIPLGWEVTRFKPIVEKYIDNRGKTPPTTDNGIPLLEVKHLPENSPYPEESTDKFVDDTTYDSWFRAHLEPNDVIISTVGTIGRICLMPNQSKLAIAQNLLGLRFKRKQVSPFFMYCQMDSFRFRHDVDARLVVTVQASIKRKDLETIDLLKPTIEVQDAFEQIVKPIFQKQIPHENRSLEFLRDTLLPKLLSGEIDLSNNQKEVING